MGCAGTFILEKVWTGSEKQKNVFEKAKNITKLLVHSDLGKPLILLCDASQYGLAAASSHQMPDDSEKQ